jgi:hypothetical protein
VACDRAQLTFGSNQQHDARRMPTPFMGKDLSMYGLEDYTRIKHVMANIES